MIQATCSTRARICLWDLLWASLQLGRDSPLRRLWGMTSPVPGQPPPVIVAIQHRRNGWTRTFAVIGP